ncbi:MAG: SAM-dependent methyltransferase, partial [Methanobacteriaceae archaeon]
MISVVGIGLCRGDMTIRAMKALEEADVIIGYGGYIRQIKDLIEGKEVISMGMGQELERAELAIKYSRQGLKVALVSSGDPGVYGMANVFFQISGKYSELEVEVI